MHIGNNVELSSSTSHQHPSTSEFFSSLSYAFALLKATASHLCTQYNIHALLGLSDMLNQIHILASMMGI